MIFFEMPLFFNDIYGTTKKKPITDELTLIQFFDLGVNEEGFWNFSHIAIQVEAEIKEVGHYCKMLNVGDVQKMVFAENDSESFHLKKPVSRQYDRLAGQIKVLDKSKKI